MKGVKMRRPLAALSAALLLALVPLSASAITFGEIDTDNQYPFVAMLAFYDADGVYSHRCSGTLMTETVVVTASHCTDGMASARAYFDVEVTDDFRNDPKKGVTGTPFTHPQFNPNNLDNDVAVVVLDRNVRRDGYPVLTTQGFLSELKAAGEIADDTFLVVGYGGSSNSDHPGDLTFDLFRRFVTSEYAGLTQQQLHLDQNPQTGGGGTCGGDSGGPHFWQDTLILVSVTGWGDPLCRSNDMTARVDTAAAQSFLATFGVVAPA
jgi:secreted trypsin-like serine protease